MKSKQPVFIIFISIALLSIAGYILTGSVRFLILAGFLTLLLLIPHTKQQPPEAAANPLKKDNPQRIPVALAGMVLLFLTPPLELHSSQKWQYPFQRGFIGLYPNVKEPAWFPDFRKDVQRDYRFEYMPSLMQGTGHFTVHFVTSPERAAEYAAQFSAQTDETYLLAECDLDGNALYADTGFFADAPDAVIYVLESNHYFNHPHSSTVVVDTASGKVELTKYG